MRVVIQRVKEASVTINGHTKSQIKGGMLILLGIEDADSHEDIEWLCRKIVALRIFDDADGVIARRRETVPVTSVLHVQRQPYHYTKHSVSTSLPYSENPSERANLEPI